MRVTEQYVKNKFKLYNQMIFQGVLPEIPVVMSRAKSFVAKLEYTMRISPSGKREYLNYRFKFSTNFDLSEREWDDSVIHEMIHYYIHFTGKMDTGPHGPVFRSMMNDINRRYGRNITITHRANEVHTEGNAAQTGRYHVVAIVTFKDGRTGLKVLPRIEPKIVHYYNAFMRNSKTQEVKLFMNNDIYFEHYPNSSVLKVHMVDTNVALQRLATAERMGCDGEKIIRHLK